MTLVRLIRDISRGPVIYKNEETNVRHLLLLVRRISTEKGCYTREFLELFAKVDTTAQNILQLLQGTSSLLYRVVSAITRHRALAEAFQALYATRELLHFHISCTLSQDVRACLEAGTQQPYQYPEIGSVDNPMSPVRRPVAFLQLFKQANTRQDTGQENCPVQGLTGAIPRSGQPRHQPRFEIVGNKIGYNALVDIGNDTIVERYSQNTASEEGPITFRDNETLDYATLKVGNANRRCFNETLATHKSPPLKAAQKPRSPFSDFRQMPGDGAGDYDDVPQLASFPPRIAEAPVPGPGRLTALITELPCSDRRSLLGQPTMATGTGHRNGWRLRRP